LEPAEELAQKLKPPPSPVETPEDSYAATETATDEAVVPGEVARRPENDRVEEVFKQVAGAADEDSRRRATTGSATEARPNGLTLVYEISAEELPSAEIELAEDYSEPPETSQPQAPPTPERTDDLQLPYEAGAEERGDAASGSAGRDFADSGTKDISSSSERSTTIADKGKPKSSAPNSAAQSRLPGMD
jgi:hypothetical protein